MSQGAEDYSRGHTRLDRNCNHAPVDRHRAIAKPPNRLAGSQEECREAGRCVGVKMTTVIFLLVLETGQVFLYHTSVPRKA